MGSVSLSGLHLALHLSFHRQSHSHCCTFPHFREKSFDSFVLKASQEVRSTHGQGREDLRSKSRSADLAFSEKLGTRLRVGRGSVRAEFGALTAARTEPRPTRSLALPGASPYPEPRPTRSFAPTVILHPLEAD